MLGATMVVTTIPVSDLERSKAFYGETLGLTLLWESPASARFRCGEVSELSIFKRPGTSTEHSLGHFEVADIEPAVKDLEAREERGPAGAILTIDGRHVSGGKDVVRAALKEARRSGRAEIWARREEGALCGLFRDGQALLTLDDAEGSPAWTSRAKSAAGGEARISFARVDGEPEEVPASWAVPAEDAARALEHFFLTGQRPSFITWHDES